MRKITANVYMTLDGRGAFPEYPTSGQPSTEANPLFRNMWYDRFDDVTTVVMGRRSFLGHQKTWSEKALDPNEPAWLLEYRRYLDRVEKVCLSHRLTSTDWENARIVAGDLAEVLAQLKAEDGGNIMLEAAPRSSESASAATSPMTTGSSSSRSSTGRVRGTGARWTSRPRSASSRRNRARTRKSSSTMRRYGRPR